MEIQEAFERMCTHIFTQGKRASTNYGQCQYLLEVTEEGEGFYKGSKRTEHLMCAIGAIMPKTLSDMQIQHFTEIGSIEDCLYADDDKELEYLHDIKLEFLTAMQECHDNEELWKYTSDMKDELNSIGVNFQLDTKILRGLHFDDR